MSDNPSQIQVITEAKAAPPAQAPATKEVTPRPALLAKATSIEWVGQTVASLCWIISVFVYGISSLGDVLQLLAACSWMVANIGALIASRKD